MDANDEEQVSTNPPETTGEESAGARRQRRRQTRAGLIKEAPAALAVSAFLCIVLAVVSAVQGAWPIALLLGAAAAGMLAASPVAFFITCFLCIANAAAGFVLGKTLVEWAIASAFLAAALLAISSWRFFATNYHAHKTGDSANG